MTLTFTDEVGLFTLHLINPRDAGALLSVPAYHTNTDIPKDTILSDGIRTIRTPIDLPSGTHLVCSEPIPEQLERPIYFQFGAS